MVRMCRLARSMIERRLIRHPRGRQPVRRRDRAVEAIVARPGVDQCPAVVPSCRSDSAHMLRSEPANCALPSGDAGEAADQRHANDRVSALRSSVERSGVPASCNDGTSTRPRNVVDLVIALVEHAGRVHPPLEVPAAIEARARMCSPTAKSHRPARAVDLVGDLRAARRCAHHQDAAVGKLTGIAILLRGQASRSSGGTRSAKAGTPAMLQAPDASTSVRHRQSPRSGAHDVSRRQCGAPTSRSCGSAPEPRSPWRNPQ